MITETDIEVIIQKLTNADLYLEGTFGSESYNEGVDEGLEFAVGCLNDLLRTHWTR